MSVPQVFRAQYDGDTVAVKLLHDHSKNDEFFKSSMVLSGRHSPHILSQSIPLSLSFVVRYLSAPNCRDVNTPQRC